MFGDIGWAEMLLIGIVALVVIGPEDLPQMFRQIGRFTAKIRAMSRDFSRAMEQAAKDTGVKDMAKDIKAATSVGGLDKVKAAADKFEKWDPIKGNTAKPAAKPLVPAPIPETPKAETPKAEVPKAETPNPDTPKVEGAAKPAAKSAAARESAPAAPVKVARTPRKKKPEADPA
jgi:sec-independent protein translocase protein TatB